MKVVMLESIAVSDKALKKYTYKLAEMGHEFVSYNDRVEDDEVLIERAKDADILIITNLPLSRRVIDNCTKLKMISVAFTGIDHIDMEACHRNNVMVCNSSGYANQAVAELVFGLLITIMRNIIPCNQAARGGETRTGLVGSEISGKKFAVIGTGAIGMRVVEIAKAFGCEVLANDIDKNERAVELGIKYVDLNTLMSEADIVSIHVPLMKSTRHLINEEKIKLMKKTAILINCARGPVLDSKALANALDEGDIAGAGIDVFEIEPPIPADHPLLNSKNTVLTPHIAFASDESFIKRADIVFENIIKWLNDNPQNVMN